MPLFACIAVMFVAALSLWGQGRLWWCPAGDLSPWAWNIWSQHNSQHLIDPYSFTHILHGILEFWLLGLIFGRLPVAWRLLMAVMIEGSWEVIENTNYVINRYREATISLDYYGDSVINSISDIAAMSCGFLLASRLPIWLIVALTIAMEVGVGYMIRDNLLLNIIMLLYPLDVIRRWQAGG